MKTYNGCNMKFSFFRFNRVALFCEIVSICCHKSGHSYPSVFKQQHNYVLKAGHPGSCLFLSVYMLLSVFCMLGYVIVCVLCAWAREVLSLSTDIILSML